jgi:hypothetical protein
MADGDEIVENPSSWVKNRSLEYVIFLTDQIFSPEKDV